MREFALDVLASQGIDFELQTPHTGENVHLSLQARRQLFLMFKECAVKAELKVVDKEIALSVEDNGRGGRQTAGMDRRKRHPGHAPAG